MNIDAKNLILGRLCTFAAKQVLLGENVNVFNCEQAVVSGKKKMIIKRYKQKVERGDPHHGPFIPKVPDKLVRRTIRGMLPWKQTRGREAYKKVMCYRGIPEKFKDEKMETVEKANIKKITDTNFMSMKELCERLK